MQWLNSLYSSVEGKCICSICSLATDVKIEWLGGSGVYVSNGEHKSAPDLPTGGSHSMGSQRYAQTIEICDIKWAAIKPHLGVRGGLYITATVKCIFNFSMKACWKCNDVKPLSRESQHDVLLAVYFIGVQAMNPGSHQWYCRGDSLSLHERFYELNICFYLLQA